MGAGCESRLVAFAGSIFSLLTRIHLIASEEMGIRQSTVFASKIWNAVVLVILSSFFTVRGVPLVSFSASEYVANEIGGTATLYVTRTGGETSGFSVDYLVQSTNGIAPQSGTLQFGNGETAKAILVPIVDDSLPQGDRRVIAQLLNPANAEIAEPSSAGLLIIENDVAGGVEPGFMADFNEFARTPTALVRQSNGRIVVKPDNGSKVDRTRLVQLTRLNEDGTRDLSFNSPRFFYTEQMGVDSLDRIVFVSRENGLSTTATLGRLRPDGALDGDFQTNILGSSPVLAVQVLADDSVLAGSYMSDLQTVPVDSCLKRFDAKGGPLSFGAGRIRFGHSNDFLGLGGITALAQQSDGKILIGGTFVEWNGVSVPGFVRLDDAGQLDTTFAPALLGPPQMDVRAICVQKDGKIVLGGAFRLPGVKNTVHVVRLDSSGNLDPGFAPVTVSQTTTVSFVDPAVWQVSEGSGGELFIRGPFNAVAGKTHMSIARLASDGAVDSAFDTARYMPGRTLFTQVASMVLDEPRGLVVCGNFVHFDFAPRTNLVRLFTHSRIPGPRQEQTIRFDPIPDRVFGLESFSVSATASSGLPVQFRVVSGPAVMDLDRLVMLSSGHVVVEALQSGDDTYQPAAPVRQAFSIAKAAQTISFDTVADRTVLDPPVLLKAAAISKLPVSFEIVSGPAVISFIPADTLRPTGVGRVTVRAVQSGDLRYEAAVAEQSFTVYKGTQMLTFAPPPELRLDWQRFQLDGYSSLPYPGAYPITYEVLSGPASVDGSMLQLLGEGLVIIRASQAGDDRVEAAVPIERTVRISSRPSLNLRVEGDHLILSWSPIFSCSVEESGRFGSEWTGSDAHPQLLNGMMFVEITLTEVVRFYRLRFLDAP